MPTIASFLGSYFLNICLLYSAEWYPAVLIKKQRARHWSADLHNTVNTALWPQFIGTHHGQTGNHHGRAILEYNIIWIINKLNSPDIQTELQNVEFKLRIIKDWNMKNVILNLLNLLKKLTWYEKDKNKDLLNSVWLIYLFARCHDCQDTTD